jgi:hypothetical protein
MYKQDFKLTFTKELWIKEFGKEVTLNIETVGKPCSMGRYYFHCNECENQSIADDENTCASCNNYESIYNEEETKYYCRNYKKVGL